MTLDTKKRAFIVGYRLGLGVGTYYDWIEARRATRPEEVDVGTWYRDFDEVAKEGERRARNRLSEYVRTLARDAESAASYYLYPEEDTTVYFTDVLGAIDAGVEEYA